MQILLLLDAGQVLGPTLLLNIAPTTAAAILPSPLIVVGGSRQRDHLGIPPIATAARRQSSRPRQAHERAAIVVAIGTTTAAAGKAPSSGQSVEPPAGNQQLGLGVVEHPREEGHHEQDAPDAGSGIVVVVVVVPVGILAGGRGGGLGSGGSAANSVLILIVQHLLLLLLLLPLWSIAAAAAGTSTSTSTIAIKVVDLPPTAADHDDLAAYARRPGAGALHLGDVGDRPGHVATVRAGGRPDAGRFVRPGRRVGRGQVVLRRLSSSSCVSVDLAVRIGICIGTILCVLLRFLGCFLLAVVAFGIISVFIGGGMLALEPSGRYHCCMCGRNIA